MTDQLAYIQDQLNTYGFFDGKGQNWGVSGSILPPDNSQIVNANFVQLDQTSDRRTIWKHLGSGLHLLNVSVERGEDTSIGDPNNCGGVWLYGVGGNVVLDDVRVTGNGAGVGLMLYGLESATLNNLRVYDMRWSRDSDPGSEQLVGIWLHHTSNCSLSNPVIKNLDGNYSGIIRAYQTDGISSSASRDFSIIGAQVRNCGEGIDISGGDGNRNFSILGGNMTDIDSFGVKLANSASQGRIIGVTSTRCGLSGFVASGPSVNGIPRCERNTFSLCDAIDTGSNGKWSAYNTCGFSTMNNTSTDPSLPERIIFDKCQAIDAQTVKTMKYGFRNENNNTLNKLKDCISIGHSVNSTLGTWG